MECTSLRPSARRSSLTSRTRRLRRDRSHRGGGFRPSTAQWFVLGPSGGRLSGPSARRNCSNVPAPGDYDGSGHTELAVFRPSTAQWFALGPSGGHLLGTFGATKLFDVPPQTSAGHSSRSARPRHEDVRAQPRAVGPACRRTDRAWTADGPAGSLATATVAVGSVSSTTPEPSSAVRPSRSLHSSSHRRPDRAIHRRPPEFPSRRPGSETLASLLASCALVIISSNVGPVGTGRFGSIGTEITGELQSLAFSRREKVPRSGG